RREEHLARRAARGALPVARGGHVRGRRDRRRRHRRDRDRVPPRPSRRERDPRREPDGRRGGERPERGVPPRRRRGELRRRRAATRATGVAATELRTDKGRIRAHAVILCTNAYSQHLVPLRIRPVRGQMLASAPLGRRVFERPAYANRGYRYWRQRPDGRLLV